MNTVFLLVYLLWRLFDTKGLLQCIIHESRSDHEKWHVLRNWLAAFTSVINVHFYVQICLYLATVNHHSNCSVHIIGFHRTVYRKTLSSTYMHDGLGPPSRGAAIPKGRHSGGPPFLGAAIQGGANQMSACGHPRSSSHVDDKKHAFKLCDGLPEEWSTDLSSLCCAWKIGNSHKVDFIDSYQPGVYCLKCLKCRWVYTSQLTNGAINWIWTIRLK